ncbi:MAG: amidohydrolase family protein [Gaiellales bacterium]
MKSLPVTNVRIDAIPLPFGEAAESLWVVDGWLTSAAVDGAVPLPGRFVAPGLVDAHAHLTIDMSGGRLRWGDRSELASRNAESQLAAGVTVIRDVGLVPDGAVDHLSEPAVISAGGLLAPPGRYHAGLTTEVAAPDLVDHVSRDVAAGAVWVKLIADFPGSDGNWFAAPPTYPIELVSEVVKVAHDGGARVAAHVSSGIVGDLVRVGVDSIEHGPLTTPELVEEMAARGIAWVPTLSTVFAKHLDPLLAEGGPVGDFLGEVYATMEASLRRAVDLGVPLLAGTDEREHGSIMLELEQLRRFGLTGAEALAAATVWPRSYLGLGTLADDEPADLVLFDDDPREGPAEPVALVVNGLLVK